MVGRRPLLPPLPGNPDCRTGGWRLARLYRGRQDRGRQSCRPLPVHPVVTAGRQWGRWDLGMEGEEGHSAPARGHTGGTQSLSRRRPVAPAIQPGLPNSKPAGHTWSSPTAHDLEALPPRSCISPIGKGLPGGREASPPPSPPRDIVGVEAEARTPPFLLSAVLSSHAARLSVRRSARRPWCATERTTTQSARSFRRPSTSKAGAERGQQLHGADYDSGDTQWWRVFWFVPRSRAIYQGHLYFQGALPALARLGRAVLCLSKRGNRLAEQSKRECFLCSDRRQETRAQAGARRLSG